MRRSDGGRADLTADGSDMKHTQFMQSRLNTQTLNTNKHIYDMTYLFLCSLPSTGFILLVLNTISNLSTLLLTVHCENCPLTQTNYLTITANSVHVSFTREVELHYSTGENCILSN